MCKKFTMKSKMNTSVCSISLILVTLISIVKSIDPTATPPPPAAVAGGIGNYGCGYFGKVDTCNKFPVIVSHLPKACTSFIYNGLILARGSTAKPNTTGNAGNGTGAAVPIPPGSDLFPSLNALTKSGKPVYLNIYHSNLKSTWKYDDEDIEMLAESDAQYLTTFMKAHGNIKGVIISDLDFTMYASDCKDFEAKLQKYVGIIKKENNIEVGLSVPATFLIKASSSKCECGADFTGLDCAFDFYLITFQGFNECGPQYVKGGTIPADGSAPNTLANLKTGLGSAKIPKAKTYFKYPVYAMADKTSQVPFANECTNTITQICANPQKTSTLCSENSKSLREKGKFANDNGNGFVIDSVDLDDHGKICKCQNAYPAFSLLIDGWTDSESFSECCLFDRIQ